MNAPVSSSELTLDFMQSGRGTSPKTPRQPDRDHISRPPGANSRPGNGGHEIRDARIYQPFLNLFSHFRVKRISFLGPIVSALSANAPRTQRLKALKDFNRRER